MRCVWISFYCANVRQYLPFSSDMKILEDIYINLIRVNKTEKLATKKKKLIFKIFRKSNPLFLVPFTVVKSFSNSQSMCLHYVISSLYNNFVYYWPFLSWIIQQQYYSVVNLVI